MKLFILSHYNYDYEKLCDEMESRWREEDESIAIYDSRIL